MAGRSIIDSLTEGVASLLFGLQPRDPLTLGIAIAVLVAIGAVAGVVPAWRASHVDPSTMLREG